MCCSSGLTTADLRGLPITGTTCSGCKCAGGRCRWAASQCPACGPEAGEDAGSQRQEAGKPAQPPLENTDTPGETKGPGDAKGPGEPKGPEETNGPGDTNRPGASHVARGGEGNTSPDSSDSDSEGDEDAARALSSRLQLARQTSHFVAKHGGVLRVSGMALWSQQAVLEPSSREVGCVGLASSLLRRHQGPLTWFCPICKCGSCDVACGSWPQRVAATTMWLLAAVRSKLLWPPSLAVPALVMADGGGEVPGPSRVELRRAGWVAPHFVCACVMCQGGGSACLRRGLGSRTLHVLFFCAEQLCAQAGRWLTCPTPWCLAYPVCFK